MAGGAFISTGSPVWGWGYPGECFLEAVRRRAWAGEESPVGRGEISAGSEGGGLGGCTQRGVGSEKIASALWRDRMWPGLLGRESVRFYRD